MSQALLHRTRKVLLALHAVPVYVIDNFVIVLDTETQNEVTDNLAFPSGSEVTSGYKINHTDQLCTR